MTGAELREIRRGLRLNQDMWAHMAGVLRSTVSEWETGKAPVPGLMARVATYLRDHPREMFSFMPELEAMLKPLSARQKLDNLEAALVEDILATPDEEFLAEVREDGGDPEAMAEEARKIFEEVTEKCPNQS